MRGAGIKSLPGTIVIVDGKETYRKLGEITERELQDAIDKARGQ